MIDFSFNISLFQKMWFERLMDTINNHWFDFALPKDKPVDFLGVMYASPSSDSEASLVVQDAFIGDFRSRIWLTYRRDFASLVDKDGVSTGITSDAGWGCSIRATQMLVAQCLMSYKLGRNWRTNETSNEEKRILECIVSIFHDTVEAPLSIHRMVQTGHARFGKKPSEWFGPTTGARTIESLINSEFSNEIGAISFDACEIISSEVTDLLSANKCVIVLLTHRLGLDTFNHARYQGTIQSLFAHPLFQGLSSGESIASAYYFFAASDDYLFYLDPHTVQPALVKGQELTPQPKPLRMRWTRLNPSMTMGFMVQSNEQWKALCTYFLKIDRELFDIIEHRRETPKFTDVSDETDEVVLIS